MQQLCSNTTQWSGKSIIGVAKHLNILATAVQQNENVQLNSLRWNVSFASSDFLTEVLCLVIVFSPVTHAVKANILLHFTTQKHRIYKPNQSRRNSKACLLYVQLVCDEWMVLCSLSALLSAAAKSASKCKL